uniref:Uncharacterized protein n=1 Tax=Anguilla anguilla TaxID=7936 RepID=A0A0E9PJ85_ANGAN
MNNESDIILVDSHPKCYSRHHHLQPYSPITIFNLTFPSVSHYHLYSCLYQPGVYLV